MSTYWDVHCRDCDEGLGLHGNHQGDNMDKLASHARLLGMMGSKLPGLILERESFPGLYTESGRIELDWFAKHKGHRIAARSEYGEIYNTCGESFHCPRCKHWLYCAKDKGHEGEHLEDQR